MHKVIIGTIALALLIVGALFSMDSFKIEEKMSLTANMFVEEDVDTFDPGLALGETFPPIWAHFAGNDISDLHNYMGEHGMIFLAVRSADWCPYCMRQMVQVQEQLGGFTLAGIGVAAMTYDSPELQQPFIEKHGIEYPLLSDIDATSVKNLGILNTDYAPGDDSYGIPYPGIYVINPDYEIVAKFFLEDYKTRLDASVVLVQAIQALGNLASGAE